MTLPKTLAPLARHKVKNVKDNEPLFALAEYYAPGKKSWTPDEWRDFLRDLDSSDLTVEEWARKKELHRVDL